MAERNITSVDLLESVTNKTNAIVEENGTLNKVNLHNEFNTINTKIDNEVNTLSNNIAQLSNPNLLINSDWRTCGMTCVNQRGSSNYIGHWQNRVYTIDRWHIGGGSNQMSVKCNSYSITLTSTGTTYQWFGQVLEQGLKEGTYTISVNVKSMTSSTYVLFDNNYFDLQVGLNTFTVTTKTSTDNIYIILHSAGTTELEYIKLEQGSIATPFVPKSYAEELALCQRYARKYYALVSVAYPYGSSEYGAFIPTDGLRIGDPTISQLSGMAFLNNGEIGYPSQTYVANYFGNIAYIRAKYSRDIASTQFYVGYFADAEIY